MENENILFVGNPPWVTNSELSSLGSDNLPNKNNFDNIRGIEAITGKSNFDISEYIIKILIDNFSYKKAFFAFLCKISVAKKIMNRLWKNNLQYKSAEIYPIDSKKYFSAAVDACLFYLDCSEKIENLEEYNNKLKEQKKNIEIEMNKINLPLLKEYNNDNFFLLAGPCVVEGEEITHEIARELKGICERLQIPLVFKASYRKANRSKASSFTGIGDEKALKVLKKVRDTFGVPVVTDIHGPEEAEMAAEYVDVLQIPAFLCRQTDLLVAAAKTGKIVNIKKGQFLSPGAMKFAADKVVEAGNSQVMLTERGTTFGYQDLLVDYRGIPEMQTFGHPVVLDVTHSLQQPNQTSGVTGGMPALIETVAKAGVAVGVDGLFMETHEDPSVAKSDGANMLKLDLLEELLVKLVRIRQAIR